MIALRMRTSQKREMCSVNAAHLLFLGRSRLEEEADLVRHVDEALVLVHVFSKTVARRRS